MESKKSINWEKIGVYIAITAALLTVIVYLFDIKDNITSLIKDDIGNMRERITKLETEIQHLQRK